MQNRALARATSPHGRSRRLLRSSQPRRASALYIDLLKRLGTPGCARERYMALGMPLWSSRSPLASASAPAPGKRQRRLLTYAPWRENQRTKLRKADSRKYRRGRGGKRVFRGCTAPFLGQSADLRQKIYQNLSEFGLRFWAGSGVKFRENAYFWKELFSIVNFIKRPKIGIWKSREN